MVSAIEGGVEVSGRRGDAALVRDLAAHRCFQCGGVLLVYHLCPCCVQLVHPGCEHVAGIQQQGMVNGSGVCVAVEARERKEIME